MPEARVAFNTLGCRLNQYESDALTAKFQQAGYTIVPFSEHADVYIINSCTVTNKADRKTRNTLNRALKLSSSQAGGGGLLSPRSQAGGGGLLSPRSQTDGGELLSPRSQTDGGGLLPSRPQFAQQDAMVVITGCFVDSHKTELERDGRSFVVDNEHKNSIFELVDAHLNGEVTHPEAFPVDRFSYGVGSRLFRTRGMLKIQDGCDNFCSFCIIPFVRGRAVSRRREEILMAAQRMLREGYRELVLTGVNMSRYDDEGFSFSDLLESLLELEGDYRLRLSSIEPDRLDDRFIKLLGHERMTPHLHLCLQSGSEKILLRMRRQYSCYQYLKIVEDIRYRHPQFNITTDLIVGFPGEDLFDFNESLGVLRRVGFGHVHVFKYSIRKGTKAERMIGHVSEKVKTERSEIIRAEAAIMRRHYRRSLIGKTQRLLVERVEKEQGGFVARGLGEHYVPIRVSLPNAGLHLENNYLRVKVYGIADDDDPDLIAEIMQ